MFFHLCISSYKKLAKEDSAQDGQEVADVHRHDR